VSEHILKRHNKTVLLYHIVCPAKYRRKVFTEAVESTLKEVCMEISDRFEIRFVEVGADEDHVHFLVQGVPCSLPRDGPDHKEHYRKRDLQNSSGSEEDALGGKFWSSGYYANTVGQYGNERVIKEYVRKQGGTYHQIHRGQLTLFDL